MKKGLRNLVIGGLATIGSLGFSSCTEDMIEPEAQNKPLPEAPNLGADERSIDISGKTVNYVDFAYDVEMKNVDEANLNLYKEGKQNTNTRIANSNISGTYEDLLKGNYTLKATSDSLEASKSFTIPDYKMTADLNGLEDSVKYDSEIDWNLGEVLEDKNVEDTVKIEYVKSLDDKVEVMVDGYNVKIKPKEGISGNSGLELKFNSGNQTMTKKFNVNVIGPEDPQYKFIVNPFVQPNQENLQWYGSGDVNSDNVVDNADYNLILGSNKDEADVDGDGFPGTSADKSLLGNKLNGSRPYLPGEWDKLQTREERVSWLNKMLAIDETSEKGYGPGFMCQSFSSQTALNLRGYPELSRDPEKGLEHNGRFNIPNYSVFVFTQDGGHSINTTIVGDDMANFNDWYFIEPQNDKQVLPGGWYMIDERDIQLRYSYIDQHGNFNNFIMTTFDMKNGVPNFVGFSDRTDVKTIKTRQESDELGN